MKGIKAAASVISLFLLASCGSVYTDSMNLLYSVPLPLLIKERVAQTAAPRFDVADTEFEDPFSLTLTSDTPGADIYYTTDGSEPGGSNGNLFRNPIPVSETMTIKAIAVKEGYVKSNVVDRRYEKCEYDVYASGVISQLLGEESYATRACYWKNGELHLLDISTNIYGSEVFQLIMVHEQLYGVGVYPDVSRNYGYWLNDDYIELTRNGEICKASSIFVYENNLYITGSVWDEVNDTKKACYWINDNFHYILDATGYSSGRRIFVYKGSVFILGYYTDSMNTRHHCYWVDGVCHEIGDEKLYPEVTDIYVNSSGIYIAGIQKNYNGVNIACYWKNDIKHDLGNGVTDSCSNAIVITDNNDVYNVGSYDDENDLPKACYWKNDEQYNLETGCISTIQFSMATSITQKNNNIYMGGVYGCDSKITTCYWKNGVKRDLYISDYYSYVFSMLVVKRI